MSATTMDPSPGVVHKVSFAVGAKCRILSGGCGMAGWSNGYSLETSAGLFIKPKQTL
jgi:hypothetical protein